MGDVTHALLATDPRTPETETGVLIYDPVSICAWKCRHLIGIGTNPGRRWGSAFTDGGLP
jgi:hypothetical protein